MRIYIVGLNADSQGVVMPRIAEFLDGAQPSLTGIGVVALAGPELLIEIEIEMVVRVPD